MKRDDDSSAWKRICYWLLILRPGDHINFDVADLGVTAKSAHNYIHTVNSRSEQRYRARLINNRAQLLVQRLPNVSPGGDK